MGITPERGRLSHRLTEHHLYVHFRRQTQFCFFDHDYVNVGVTLRTAARASTKRVHREMTPPRQHEHLQPPARLRPRACAPLIGIEADGLAEFVAIAREFQRGLPAEHNHEHPAGVECSAPGYTGPQIQTSSDSQDPQDDPEPQSTESAQSAADTPMRGALGENRKREQAPELRNVRCEDILEEFHVYARLHEVRRPRRQKLQSSMD